MMVYTIGHSTRSLDAFVLLLKAHAVTRLADVRSVPSSRRHPHFGADRLARSLPAEGVAYRHFPGLGGLRTPRPDSPNAAWRHEGFRGYADHMDTAEFDRELDELLAFSTAQVASGVGDPRVVIMCAEAVWWHCHRQLVADALLARGIEVRHIMSEKSAPSHVLTDFAKICGRKVSYRGLLC